MKRAVPKIPKNTAQRKNPITQEKINQVSNQVEFPKILKTVPSMKLGSDNDQTVKDQSVCQTRRDSGGALHRQRDRCASDVTKERSNSPNRSLRTLEMHQVQSIDTIDNISVNRQRQMPRTGTAQWQDLKVSGVDEHK